MIQERAMLARLSISQWTGRAFDSKVSTEVERAHGAHDAGRFNKALVSKSLLDPISKLAGEVRKHHYSISLPWSDSGERLLPAKLFMEYTAQMRSYRSKMDALVSDLVAAYPAEVQSARVRLGTMYDPGDYPDPNDIKQAFGLTFEFTPVPNAKDFRVDVSDEAADEIRSSIKQAVCIRQAEAVRACFDRIRDVVSKIHERLSDERAVFKDSLITNAIDLCRVLDGLNITDDPQITELGIEIKQKLLMNPSALRTRPDIRAQVARDAATILARIPT